MFLNVYSENRCLLWWLRGLPRMQGIQVDPGPSQFRRLWGNEHRKNDDVRHSAALVRHCDFRVVPGTDMRACRVSWHRQSLGPRQAWQPPLHASHRQVRCGKRSLFGDRPPLRDTLTGGRPPGRKVPDPNWGLEDNKRKRWVAKLPWCLKIVRRRIAGMRAVPFL